LEKAIANFNFNSAKILYTFIWIKHFLTLKAKKMQTEIQVKVNPDQIESLGRKLEHLYVNLSEVEKDVFQYLMEAIASEFKASLPLWLKPQIHIKPRGGRHLVIGGANGLLVVITGRGRLVVVKPEGPLPTEFPPDILGAILISSS
jgi:hypothetical protein